jgi:hypothetical protein
VNWDPTWTSLVSGLLGVAIGGVISFLSQMKAIDKQFEQQESIRAADAQKWIDQMWWDKKATAYGEIIDALWESYNYNSEYLDYISGANGPDAKAPAPNRDWKKDRATIKRAEDMGAFYISTRASESIREYVRYLYSIEGRDLNFLDELIDATEKCLDAVKMEAARDLRIQTQD